MLATHENTTMWRWNQIARVSSEPMSDFASPDLYLFFSPRVM